MSNPIMVEAPLCALQTAPKGWTGSDVLGFRDNADEETDWTDAKDSDALMRTDTSATTRLCVLSFRA